MNTFLWHNQAREITTYVIYKPNNDKKINQEKETEIAEACLEYT